ncbi:tetratricopeptide repeat protein [Thermodesulfatator autotrophicus]|uniref:Tetratricopeptide repeat protein n=1 Tax=Thermodesulfatator autotrophicus TaxID=1795632 RepID=A0A177E5Z3_9BACT|nr:hypothetical protein [Thermodesulfatator autotrophicus]OAG27383.1 hypothetical protein TH606_07225 [Thermodesulfatator autotrophicus]
MRLKLKFFPEIQEGFYALSFEEIKNNVRRIFKNAFLIEGNKLEIGLEELFRAEKFFSSLQKLLNSSGKPLPVSLVPEEKEGLFRPGKIYLLPETAKKLRNQVKDWPYPASLIPWQKFYELEIPSTKDSPSKFPLKDLLLLGPFPVCPLCGLRWHKSTNCPGVKGEFFEFPSFLLNKTPQAMLTFFLETLTNKASKESFKFWSKRLFYLRPGVLKNILAANPETWERMPRKGLSGPGGNFSLALEALYHGHLDESKRRFNEVDSSQELLALLGLIFVAMVKGDYAEAIFNIEKAKTLAQSPFLKAYLSFLRGWLSEIDNKHFEAEEHYKEALKRDRTFWPAKYHLARIYIKISPNKARNLALSMTSISEAIPLLLSEPLFIPFSLELEKEIELFFESRQREAIRKLAQAENALRPITKTIPEEDKNIFQERINELREKIYNGGFKDLIWAEQKAMELSLELQGYLFRKVKKLREKYKELKIEYEKYENYWKNYPYRQDAQEFKSMLDSILKDLRSLNTLFEGNASKRLKQIQLKSKQIEKNLELLEKKKQELEQRRKFLKQLNSFVKIFVILESLLFGIFAAIPFMEHFFKVEKPPFFSIEAFLAFSLLILLFSLFYALRQKN